MVNMKDLVSIIVPAYNVSAYLEQCIGSLIKQSYENIEIIIVNDGSTDNTPLVANQFEQKDERVKVIHKKNEGVSAARNTGLDTAKGKYIVFVDADDFLALDFIEYMLIIVEKTGAEFCLSKNCYTQVDEKQVENDTIECLSPEDGTALLLSPRVIVGCWNKIYKKDFLLKNNLRFSTTLFYGEGLSFITEVAQKSKCVGVGNRKVYYYRRNNELSATTKFNIEKMRNGEKALNNIKNRLIIRTDKVLTMWNLHMCMFCLGAVTKILANNVKNVYYKDYQHWYSYLRKHYIDLAFNKYVPIYRKMLLFGGCICPRIMTELDIRRRKRIAQNSVKN